MSAVKHRLKEKQVTINESKSIELTDSIKFLGFIISSRGIEPDSNLINKILDLKEPTNVKEIESFVGLVNYFGRMIPNFANILAPINHLRKKCPIYMD